MLIPQHLSFVRLIVAVLLSNCYLVLLLIAQPYRHRSTMFVAVGVQLSLALTLFAALLVRVVGAVNTATDYSADASSSQVLGFDNAFPLTVCMLVANFGVLVLVLALVLQQAADERLRSMLLSPEDFATLNWEMDEAATKQREEEESKRSAEKESRRLAVAGEESKAQHSPRFHFGPLSPKIREMIEMVRSRVGIVGRQLSFVNQAWQLQGSKHECDVEDLIAGEVEDAARGLPHFMGVDDPFSSAGVEQIEQEVSAYVAMLRSLSLQALEERGFARCARAGEPGGPENTAAAIVSCIVHEVQGNLHYILHQPSEEATFHNGVRDVGRSFGQFCKQATVEEHHTRQMADQPDSFFLDPKCEVYKALRPKWDTLGDEEKKGYAVGFDYFVNHPNAQEAQLAPVHVLALRLYTTHAFKYLNGPLRDVRTYGHGKRPHPLPMTVMYIAEGIKKMRAVYVVKKKESATVTTSLWRGMKGLQVTEGFKHNNRGGTGRPPTHAPHHPSLREAKAQPPGRLSSSARAFRSLQHRGGARVRS